MSFVEFRDVSKVYHMGDVEVRAVDGMDFSMEQGEFVVIVGPSGAGKTTVLNMLGGMDTVTSGTIMLDGREVSAFSEHELTMYRRHDVGFVFQFYNLVQNLTALENVELASQICRDPLDPAEVLAQVGLADRMENFPRSSRAASSSASPSPAPLRRTPSSCSATSPRARSTTRRARPSSGSCRTPATRRDARSPS